MLFQCNEGRKIIKIGNDLDLLQRVKERFDLDGEIVLQKYNDSWGEWVDVSCPEICHMDKIKVVRLAEPHNQVCLLSFVVHVIFFSTTGTKFTFQGAHTFLFKLFGGKMLLFRSHVVIDVTSFLGKPTTSA